MALVLPLCIYMTAEIDVFTGDGEVLLNVLR